MIALDRILIKCINYRNNFKYFQEINTSSSVYTTNIGVAIELRLNKIRLAQYFNSNRV